MTEILQQIFQDVMNILRKSERIKKKNIFVQRPSPTIALWPPPHHPIHHNGDLSACEQKMLHLRTLQLFPSL